MAVLKINDEPFIVDQEVHDTFKSTIANYCDLVNKYKEVSLFMLRNCNSLELTKEDAAFYWNIKLMADTNFNS